MFLAAIVLVLLFCFRMTLTAAMLSCFVLFCFNKNTELVLKVDMVSFVFVMYLRVLFRENFHLNDLV